MKTAMSLAYETVPDTVAPAAVVSKILEVVIDAGFMASLNVTLRFALVETPVVLSAGVKERTVGAISTPPVVNVHTWEFASGVPEISWTPVVTVAV